MIYLFGGLENESILAANIFYSLLYHTENFRVVKKWLFAKI